MSKSKIEVTISHDGEYCGECKFLRAMPIRPNYIICWCKAYTIANTRTCGGLVKRCDACMERAVAVEAEQEEE